MPFCKWSILFTFFSTFTHDGTENKSVRIGVRCERGWWTRGGNDRDYWTTRGLFVHHRYLAHTQSLSAMLQSFSHQTYVMPAEQEARLINSEVGVPVWSRPANRVPGITGLTWQRPPLILQERHDRKVVILRQSTLNQAVILQRCYMWVIHVEEFIRY